jgi:hypothetical protein
VKRGEPCEGKGKLLRLGSEIRRAGSRSETGAFAGFPGEPTGLSGRGEGRRNDATGLTDGVEAVPAVGGDDAAAVRGK